MGKNRSGQSTKHTAAGVSLEETSRRWKTPTMQCKASNSESQDFGEAEEAIRGSQCPQRAKSVQTGQASVSKLPSDVCKEHRKLNSVHCNM